MMTLVYSGEGKEIKWDESIKAYRIKSGALEAIYWPENIPYGSRDTLESNSVKAMYDHFHDLPTDTQKTLRRQNVSDKVLPDVSGKERKLDNGKTNP